MSKENVALFSRAIGRNADLSRRVREAEPTADAWVQIARDTGLEFTPEEFASVVGETLGRPVATSDAAREYLAAQHKLGDLELSRKNLEAVVGGRARAYTGDGVTKK